MDKLLQFLTESTCEFTALANLEELLKTSGFTKLEPSNDWTLKNGGVYYLTTGQSALIAFKIGLKFDCGGYNVVATHLDSPNLKLKPNGLIGVDKFTMANTEVYGGAILDSWFDTPLGLAGRIVVKENSKLQIKIVDAKKDLFVIPRIAPHLKKDVVINPQKDLLPLVSLKKQNDTKALISEIFKLNKEDIVSFDLSLYNRAKASIVGVDNDLISSPRLDNLECTYLGLNALLESNPNDAKVNVFVAFNNEEVGSSTAEGALSNLLHDVLFRISGDEINYQKNLSQSVMISADNAHAVHPNYLELADPTNKVYMNEGVVLKHNANKRYTTDAVGDAIISSLCEANKIPYQHYTNRSDQRGGSTLGCLSLTKVSIKTVDIGLSQLAMHSSLELAGAKDATYMLNLLKAFYNSNYQNKNDEFLL